MTARRQRGIKATGQIAATSIKRQPTRGHPHDDRASVRFGRFRAPARRMITGSATPTPVPRFDVAAYARVADGRSTLADIASVKAEETALASSALDEDPPPSDAETGQTICTRYLESDFPSALSLAESLLARRPDHSLAQVIAERCRDAMVDAESHPPPSRLDRSSVLRVTMSPKGVRGSRLDPRVGVRLLARRWTLRRRHDRRDQWDPESGGVGLLGDTARAWRRGGHLGSQGSPHHAVASDGGRTATPEVTPLALTLR